MTCRDFAFWLQGYFEIAGGGPLTADQADLVRRHLSLVFAHDIDPQAGPSAVQKKLNDIHGGGPSILKDLGTPRC